MHGETLTPETTADIIFVTHPHPASRSGHRRDQGDRRAEMNARGEALAAPHKTR
jgi:hypothetical protein